jgi:hypothetical protein
MDLESIIELKWNLKRIYSKIWSMPLNLTVSNHSMYTELAILIANVKKPLAYFLFCIICFPVYRNMRNIRMRFH